MKWSAVPTVPTKPLPRPVPGTTAPNPPGKFCCVNGLGSEVVGIEVGASGVTVGPVKGEAALGLLTDGVRELAPVVFGTTPLCCRVKIQFPVGSIRYSLKDAQPDPIR